MVSVVVLLALAPLLVALWLLVWSTSAGPGLFRQERVGLRMRRFSMLKLRTMYVSDSDQIHRDYVAGLLVDGQEPSLDREGCSSWKPIRVSPRSEHGSAGPAWMSCRSCSTCLGGRCP